ncbi:MAG TPA: DUF3307 domain-containing protein [Alphaproteobacteria bacterium]|nr:DUF3307 domain-containing protein [Alphaproteobacteria bacterium]
MIPLWSSWTPSPSTALLVLLLLGHVLADFLVQTRKDVEARARGTGYLSHGAAVLVTHLAVLFPQLTTATAGAVVAITALHVLIDLAKDAWLTDRRGRLRPFVLDQGAHVAVVLAAWGALTRLDAVPAFRWLSAEQVGTYLALGILVAAFAFNASGGSVIVAGVLDRLRDADGRAGDAGPAGYPGAGRMIGILERTLTLALVLYGEWAAIALLITAKSIARFEEIKVRKFAEYYLVGTLTSLLVALVIGLLLGEVFLPAIL